MRPDRPPARRQSDDGQVTTALLLLAILFLLYAMVVALLPLGRAGDLKTQAQSAADAAALAGAQRVRDTLEADLAAAVVVGPAGPVLADLRDRTLGFDQAQTYAALNRAGVGGALSNYQWNPDTSTVTVHVTGTQTLGADRAEADASASLGIDLSACRFEPDPAAPPPPPAPAPGPPPPPAPGPPPPPAPTPTLLTCGSLVIPGDDDGAGHFTPRLGGLDLRTAIVPRLVS